MSSVAVANSSENNAAAALSLNGTGGGYMNQNVAQEKYVPLSVILDSAIHRTYRQLMIMIDMWVFEYCIISIH